MRNDKKGGKHTVERLKKKIRLWFQMREDTAFEFTSAINENMFASQTLKALSTVKHAAEVLGTSNNFLVDVNNVAVSILKGDHRGLERLVKRVKRKVGGTLFVNFAQPITNGDEKKLAKNYYDAAELISIVNARLRVPHAKEYFVNVYCFSQGGKIEMHALDSIMIYIQRQLPNRFILVSNDKFDNAQEIMKKNERGTFSNLQVVIEREAIIEELHDKQITDLRDYLLQNLFDDLKESDPFKEAQRLKVIQNKRDKLKYLKTFRGPRRSSEEKSLSLSCYTLLQENPFVVGEHDEPASDKDFWKYESKVRQVLNRKLREREDVVNNIKEYYGNLLNDTTAASITNTFCDMIFGTVVKESSVEGAGLGLFADRDFPAHSLVAEMVLAQDMSESAFESFREYVDDQYGRDTRKLTRFKKQDLGIHHGDDTFVTDYSWLDLAVHNRNSDSFYDNFVLSAIRSEDLELWYRGAETVHAKAKPRWYYMNNAEHRQRANAKIYMKGHIVFFYTIREVKKGQELLWLYEG